MTSRPHDRRHCKPQKTDPDLASMAAVIVTAVTVLDGVPFGFEDVVSNRRQAPTPERYFPELIDEVDSANIIHNIRFDSVTISPYETAIA